MRPPAGIIAVVRAATREAGEVAMRGLLASRVDAVELTLTTPGGLEVLAGLRRDAPGTRLLAGTVMTLAEVDAAADLGLGGVVSPHLDPELVARALARGVPPVPGTLTPTEIAAALRLGAPAVKVFPVGLVGGVEYVRALRGPLPDVAYVVSGGIAPAEAAAYLAAGCHAVCMGGALIDADAVARGDVDGVARYADARLAELAALTPTG